MVIPAWFGGNGEGGEEEEPHGCLEHGADNIIAGLVGGREAGSVLRNRANCGIGDWVCLCKMCLRGAWAYFGEAGRRPPAPTRGPPYLPGLGLFVQKPRLYSIVKERGGRASREDVPCCAVAQNRHGWDFAKQSQSPAAAVLRGTYFWE